MVVGMTQERFVERVQKVHGESYDYSNTVYKNTKFPVVIVCQVHGDRYDYKTTIYLHSKTKLSANCNDKVFDKAKINPTKDMTYGSLFEATQEKRDAFMNAGYSYVEMWESNFNGG